MIFSEADGTKYKAASLARTTAGVVPAACLLLQFACAPRVPALPAGAGAPFPDYSAAYTQATDRCRGVRTFLGVLELSGRAGTTRLRSRLDAGFAAPAQARLELPAPLGRPVFVLVAQGGIATLLLPRDRRILRDEAPDAIVEALAGVALDADELRALVAGCGLGPVEPTGGRAFPDRWVAVDGADTTAWLRETAGTWRLMAITRNHLAIWYRDYSAAGRPETIRILTTPPEPEERADLTIRLSQVEINTQLHPDTFKLDAPPEAVPLTLDELRRAGPLGSATEVRGSSATRAPRATEPSTLNH